MVMSESGTGKSQDDIDSLKEALCAQQKLLQKLYNEFDAEREATANAASEALSMILRLQEEKAAMKMETEQYKRLAEEKMCHAEESLAIFEDLMYQKEMEVAAMDYQVQTYKYKLLSLGCADPGIGEIKFPENLLQRNETLGGEISLESLGRRNSASPSAIKFSYTKKGDVEKENSLSPDTNLCTKISEDSANHDLNRSNSDFEKRADGLPSGGLNSHWEKIRKLDGRVKEIAGVGHVNLRSSIRSPSPQLSSGSAYDLTKGSNANEMVVNLKSFTRSPSPQLSSGSLHGLTKGSNANGVDVDKHASEILESQMNESVRSRAVLDVFHRSNATGEINCNMALVCPASTVSFPPPMLHQVNRVSEIVEAENQNAMQPLKDREEELKLLNEIREQLSSIQSQIRSLKTKQPKRKDELSLGILEEEMLHFWL